MDRKTFQCSESAIAKSRMFSVGPRLGDIFPIAGKQGFLGLNARRTVIKYVILALAAGFIALSTVEDSAVVCALGV
jgi:hypothetical protein